VHYYASLFIRYVESVKTVQARLGPNSSKPNPTVGKGLGGAEGGSAGATPPRLRGAKSPHGVVNGIVLGKCSTDECTDEWQNLQAQSEAASSPA
jgi:hypothetical protein